MNIPTVGSYVRVTVRYLNINAFETEQYKTETYEGKVVPNEKWDGPASFCMTGDKYIRVRNIRPDYVQNIEYISGSERKIDVTGFRGFKVESKGKTYLVGVQHGRKFTCNCTGFGYRKTCSHVQAVAKRVMQ